METELTKRGIAHTRDEMRDLANEWRKEYGADYIVKALYQQASDL